MSVLALIIFILIITVIPLKLGRGASGIPFIALSLFPKSTVRVIIPALRSFQLVV